MFVISDGACVPSLDNPRLGSIDIAFVLDMLDANFDAVLGDNDVTRGEAVLGIFANLGCSNINLVAHETDASHDQQQDDQRKDLTMQGRAR